MKADDFITIDDLLKNITNRKIDTDKKKINWLSTHEIVLQKDKPFIFRFKKTLNSQEQELDVTKKKWKGNLKDFVLKKANPVGKTLNEDKTKDLKKLVQKYVISEYKNDWEFLDNVETNNNDEIYEEIFE